MTRAVREAIAQPRHGARVAGRGRRSRRSSSSRSWAIRSCTTSCSGIDPTPLGSAPFALATDAPSGSDGRVSWSSRRTRAPASTCCRASPATSARTRPGAILAETPYLADEVTLLVDVGTNAEIVLGSKDRLLAASSPTGPGLRGRADLVRPARRAGRDRAGADRQGHPRAALPRHRLVALVGRDRLRRRPSAGPV